MLHLFFAMNYCLLFYLVLVLVLLAATTFAKSINPKFISGKNGFCVTNTKTCFESEPFEIIANGLYNQIGCQEKCFEYENCQW